MFAVTTPSVKELKVMHIVALNLISIPSFLGIKASKALLISQKSKFASWYFGAVSPWAYTASKVNAIETKVKANTRGVKHMSLLCMFVICMLCTY